MVHLSLFLSYVQQDFFEKRLKIVLQRSKRSWKQGHARIHFQNNLIKEPLILAKLDKITLYRGLLLSVVLRSEERRVGKEWRYRKREWGLRRRNGYVQD